jgi:hypothetical protein
LIDYRCSCKSKDFLIEFLGKHFQVKLALLEMKIKASRLGLDTYKCSWQGVSGIVIKSGPDLVVNPGLD